MRAFASSKVSEDCTHVGWPSAATLKMAKGGSRASPTPAGGRVLGSSALIASASFASPSFLDTIISNPAAASCVLRYSPANMAKPMILVLGTILRKADAVSMPYSIGMFRSSITKAGARSLAFWTAGSPLPASQQALKRVALSMKLQIAPRTAVLSSTTRIHGVRGSMAEETTSDYCLGQYEFSLFFVYCALAAERHSVKSCGLPSMIFVRVADIPSLRGRG